MEVSYDCWTIMVPEEVVSASVKVAAPILSPKSWISALVVVVRARRVAVRGVRRCIVKSWS